MFMFLVFSDEGMWEPDSRFWIMTHRCSIFIIWKLERTFNESLQEFMFVTQYCSPRSNAYSDSSEYIISEYLTYYI